MDLSFAVVQTLLLLTVFLAELSASAGSKVVVVTANAWSGEQSYVSVVQTNVDLYRGIVPGLARLSPSAVMIVASQPGGVTTSFMTPVHSWNVYDLVSLYN